MPLTPREYYLAHREAILAKAKERYASMPKEKKEARRKRQAEYARAHADACLERNRAYREANPEKYEEYHRAYYLNVLKPKRKALRSRGSVS